MRSDSQNQASTPCLPPVARSATSPTRFRRGRTWEAVLNAGLQAPFAEMAIGDRLDYRRFVVVSRGGSILRSPPI